ncbi:MAG TPA: type I 3-dehydroquinate dehydratase [Planctomycetota bacterium]|nr:type I 3-dehydroquinate dehydratase [Planctomycetota bacterium]
MPVVVSHIDADFERLAARALRQAALADLVEVRLDRLRELRPEALAAFVAACPKPVIAACPGPEAHGEFPGPVEERLEVLRVAARAGCRFVDVDQRLSLDLGEVEAPCHRIVSRHELDGTPLDLAALHEEVRAVLYEGDIVKIVTHAECAEDGLRVLNYLRVCGGGLVAFCSGAAGSFTRLLAPIFGSPFTYAAPADLPGEETGDLTGPGQLRVNDFLALAPPGGLSGETAIFGVVGVTARHSWSPRVHGMALKAARLDALYLAFEPRTIESFLELASDESFRGFSITAPYKGGAAAFASSLDGASERAGAANTLIREGRGWRGLNTDVGAVAQSLGAALAQSGLMASMESACADVAVLPGGESARAGSLREAHTLVLGCGGAARAVCQAVREAGGSFTVAGRDAERAASLARELGGECAAWESIPAIEHDVLVHCTPVGSVGSEGESPIPAQWLREGTIVMDAVYRPMRTALMAAAEERNCLPVPGREWFVRQASAQFRLFTGHAVDEAIMRAAFEHAADGK